MSKGYEPSSARHHIHTDSTGTLPPERLTTGDTFDGTVPPAGQLSVVAYDPAIDDAPHWRTAGELFSAYLLDAFGAPSYELDGNGLLFSSTFEEGSPPEQWVVPATALGKRLELAFAGGVGAATVSAEIPFSIAAAEAGGRTLMVRLVVDGAPSVTEIITAASSGTTGDDDIVSITGDWVLPPLASHLIQLQVAQEEPNIGEVSFYTDGPVINIVPLDAPSSGTVGGDLSGELPSPSVIALQGNPVADALPADGDVLTWNEYDNEWQPAAPTGGGGGGSILMTVSGGPVMTPGGGLIVVGVS